MKKTIYSVQQYFTIENGGGPSNPLLTFDKNEAFDEFTKLVMDEGMRSFEKNETQEDYINTYNAIINGTLPEGIEREMNLRDNQYTIWYQTEIQIDI